VKKPNLTGFLVRGLRVLPRRGFSIIEITIAMAILATAMIFFIPVFTQGMTFTKDIRDYSVISALAEELTHSSITEINSIPIGGTKISVFEDDITEMVKTKFKNEVFNGIPKFKVLRTIRPTVLCVSGGYEIIHTIQWETGGRPKNFSLFTVKAENHL